MTEPRERIARGDVNSEHLLHLFDDVESLAETASDCLHEGWSAGEALLVVARPQHWSAIAEGLESKGCRTDDVAAAGALTVLDAAGTLASFLRHGFPDRDLFFAKVGGVVHSLSSPGRRLRIYGEMVDILAERRDLVAAEALERLWNELACTCSFTLLCGYAAIHFGDPKTSKALHAICGTHDRASSSPADLLGTWLLAERHRTFHSEPS